MDIADWLHRLGLNQYEKVFRDNDVDAEMLPSLTADDLRELGVASLGHRKKLLSAIAALSQGLESDPAPKASPASHLSRARGTVKPERAERRHLTVMFVDLVGSTALSARLDPEEMRGILAAYHQSVATAVAGFEGHIAKFMGDGVLVYFGWPRAHEDEAERAVRAGLAIVQAVGELRSRADGLLSARVGIATGLVVVGDLIGEGAAQEEAVVGQTPNLAARLQQLAAPGTVVVAESTRRLLGDLFTLIELGSQEIRGIDARVPVVQVVGEARAESRFEALRRVNSGPLIGREHELALLLARWEVAKSGEGQAVLLSGEAGIGKSRIVLALHEQLRAEARLRISYSCSPHYVNSALWPVVTQLQHAAGFLREDATSLKLEKLEQLVGRGSGSSDEAVSAIAELMGLPLDGRYPVPGGTPQEKKWRLFGVLLAQLEGLAREQPMLIVLEDAHWLDPTSAELFDRVVDRIQCLPILFVATLRPEAPLSWMNLPHATLLGLNRLARPAAQALVERAAGDRPLPPVIVEAILSRTEGVPLFIEELTKAVLESGILKAASSGGPLELAGPLLPMAIPTTLQDSLMARLDRLPPARDVAQIAACIGRDFEEDMLGAVAGYPGPQLAEALEQLCRTELIQRHGTPPRHYYSFKHVLVRDAAYGSLLNSRRQQLHARIAMEMERLRPEISANQPEIIADHFVEGGLSEKGADCLLSAGRLAKARHAVREAISQLEKCLRVLAGPSGESVPAARKTERECLLLLGDLGGITDDLERANACYERAMSLSLTEAERQHAGNRVHRTRYTERNGARLAFYEHGSGEPAILFVNPLVYGLSTFQPILEQLCQDFRIITVECRGVGRSSPLSRPYSTLDHMEDVRMIINAANAAPIVGVGISRGSNLLIQLARAYPELVGKLMLVGTPLSLPGGGQGAWDPEYFASRQEFYRQGAAQELIHLQMRFVYSESDADELRRINTERLCRLPTDTILSFYDPDPGLDIAPLLESITVPTLVTNGRADRLVPCTSSEYIASHIPGAQLYFFEGKGHLPMFSATQEFCDVVRTFIRTGRPEERGRYPSPSGPH